MGAQLSAVESNNDKALVRNVCGLAYQDSAAIFCTMSLLVLTLSFGFVLLKVRNRSEYLTSCL